MRSQLCAALLVGLAISTSLSACTATPASLSGAELSEVLQLREAQLQDLASTYGLTDLPEIPTLVRWVTQEEAADVQVECLNEAGFPAESLGGSGVGFDRIPDEQKQLGGPLHVAMWECAAQYTVDPRTQIPFTTEQYRIVHQYLDTTLRDCLAERGYEFSEAPSLETFIQGYESGEPWVPWGELPLADLSDVEFAQLEEACPQEPPSTQLYGAPLPQPDNE